MRCLVTGAAGFIGSRLAAALVGAGNEVLGIDRLSSYYDVRRKEANLDGLRSVPGFTFLRRDLCDLVPQDLPGRLDVVFHLAAQPGVRGSWGAGFALYVRDNILASQRLLECVAALTEPPRVIYSSSSSVYGAARDYPTAPTSPTRPRSPYGVSKLAAEALMGAYSSDRNVPAVSLRYFTVYGPGQRPDMAISKLIEAALTHRPFTVFGDGRQTRDFTFVDDVVRANLLAAQVSLPDDHQVFNVSGGAELGLADLIAIVEDTTGEPVDVVRSPAMPGDPPRTSGDTVATRQCLGWTPMIGMREGIAKQVQWHVGARRDSQLVT